MIHCIYDISNVSLVSQVAYKHSSLEFDIIDRDIRVRTNQIIYKKIHRKNSIKSQNQDKIWDHIFIKDLLM